MWVKIKRMENKTGIEFEKEFNLFNWFWHFNNTLVHNIYIFVYC